MNASPLLVLGLVATFIISGVQSVTFTVTNNCPFTIWPGTLAGGGKAQLSLTGFELATGAAQTMDAPPNWSGRFWARTGCSAGPDGRFSCESADCGSGQVSCNGAGAIPPASLAEITLAGSGNLDFYDISLVDGFNLPVAMTPQGACPATSCPVDINAACPPELALTAGGHVAGCKSACLAFGSAQYCCFGAFGSPETCPPTDYSRIFKERCPQAYSYAYDDKSSTFTCSSGPNYVITFCP